ETGGGGGGEEPGAAPERDGRAGEHDAAERRTGEEADLPGRRTQRHVAPEQCRWREVGDQRVVHGAVDALGDAERDDHAAEDDDRERAVEPRAGGEDGERRAAEDRARGGEGA